MRVRWWVRAAAAGAFVVGGTVLGGLPAAGAASAAPVSIPVVTKTITTGSQQISYAVVMASVAGGPTVPFLLDTGSSGVVALSNYVGSQAKSTGKHVTLNYDSGGVTGNLQAGPVKLGPLTSSASTQFVSAAANQTSSLLAGLTAYGVDGIFGIAPTDSESVYPFYSPLLTMPSPYWKGFTLELARSGTGTLMVGPVSAPSTAVDIPMTADNPAHLSNGEPAWQVGVTLCWSLSAKTAHCGITEVDSGSPVIAVDPYTVPGLPSQNGLSVDAGTAMALSLPNGSPVWSYTAGNTYPDYLTVYFPHKTEASNTSILFFFDHTVAFNITSGQIEAWAPAG
jgi:hypothetical protein